VAPVNYTVVALLVGSVMLMVASALATNAPAYVPIARVDLSTAEASLRHAALNALAAYVNGKAPTVGTALSQNLNALDERFVPWSSYTILSYSPTFTADYWSEASLFVKYTLSVGGRPVDYTCSVRFGGSVVSSGSEGIYFAVTVKFYDENGLIASRSLIFDPKPVKVEAFGDFLKLYFFQKPESIDVVDERGLRIRLRLEHGPF